MPELNRLSSGSRLKQAQTSLDTLPAAAPSRAAITKLLHEPSCYVVLRPKLGLGVTMRVRVRVRERVMVRARVRVRVRGRVPKGLG